MRRFKIFQLAIVVALIASMLSPALPVAYADEGTTADPEPAEETSADTGGGSDSGDSDSGGGDAAAADGGGSDSGDSDSGGGDAADSGGGGSDSGGSDSGGEEAGGEEAGGEEAGGEEAEETAEPEGEETQAAESETPEAEETDEPDGSEGTDEPEEEETQAAESETPETEETEEPEGEETQAAAGETREAEKTEEPEATEEAEVTEEPEGSEGTEESEGEETQTAESETPQGEETGDSEDTKEPEGSEETEEPEGEACTCEDGDEECDCPEEGECVADVVKTMDENDMELVDENGESVPLASQEAADALSSDPYFTANDGSGTVVGYSSGASCHASVTECHANEANPIQAAIDDNRSTDTTINVEADTYQEQVTINKSLKLVGSGKKSTTIKAPASLDGDDYIVTIDGLGSSINVVFKKFKVEGNGTGTNDPNGILVTGGAKAKVKNNEVTNTQTGITVDDSAGNTKVKNNDVNNNNVGMEVTGADDAENADDTIVEKNTFEDNDVQMEVNDPDTDADTFIDNALNNNDFDQAVTVDHPANSYAPTKIFSWIQDAVDAADDGDTIYVEPGTYSGSVIVYREVAIQSTGDASNTFIDASTYAEHNPLVSDLGEGVCKKTDCYDPYTWAAKNKPGLLRNGFLVFSDNVTVDGFTINNAQHNSGYNQGIGVLIGSINTTYAGFIPWNIDKWGGILPNPDKPTPTGVTVQNNVIPSASDGVYIWNSNDNLIQDNVIENSTQLGGSGITVWDGGTGNVFHGNVIYNVAGNGIVLGNGDVSDTLIEDNQISNAGGKGVDASWSTSGDNVRILNNDIIDNANNGVILVNMEDITISGNTINNNGVHGIQLDDISTGTIKNNTANGSTYGGIVVTSGSNNLLIEQNTFEANDFYGAVVMGSANDVTLQNNFFIDNGLPNPGNANASGLLVYDNAGDNVVVYDNSFDNNVRDLVNGSIHHVDASGNWWGSSDPATVANGITGDVDYSPWLASGTDTDPGTAGFQGDFSVLWVDDDSPQSNATGHIQEGIDMVSGSTVNVAAGTYNENVVITKLVTLDGAGSGSDPVNDTIIQAANASQPVIKIEASGNSETDRMVFQDFRVTGATSNGNNGSGILFAYGSSSGSYTTINNVVSTGNHIGVNIDAKGADVVDLEIQNSDLSNNNGKGLNQNSYVDIDGLTLSNTLFDNNNWGAYLEASLRGLTISNSSFDNNNKAGMYVKQLNHNDPASGWSTQLPATINNTTFNDNGWHGLYFWGWGGPSFTMDNVEASSNNEIGLFLIKTSLLGGQEGRDSAFDDFDLIDVTADNNGSVGIYIYALIGDIHDLNVENATVTNNTGSGIKVKGRPESVAGPFLYGGEVDGVVNNSTSDGNSSGIELADPMDGVLITNSTLINNGVGIWVRDDAAAGGSSANENTIMNNTVGVQNDGTTTVFDATYNWWGAADGPGGVGPGSGDAVSDYVDYDPWSTNANHTANSDDDADLDGVANAGDNCPNDANAAQADADNDGVGDVCDAFPNDPSETTDSDGDGVGDNADAFPDDPTEWADTDGDGVGDNADAFPNDPAETTDSDGDGVGDNADAFPNDPAEWADSDGDGVGDNADNCVADWNPGQEDADEDGVGDVCEDPGEGGDGGDGTGTAVGTTVAGGPVVIPVTGGEAVALGGSAITLTLPNGDQATFSAGSGDTASLLGVEEGDLPDALPDGSSFVSAMTTGLFTGTTPVTTLPSGESIILSFQIPEGMEGATFTLLAWDATANDGLGDWVEVPATVTPDGTVQATVNFTGTFVLTTP